MSSILSDTSHEDKLDLESALVMERGIQFADEQEEARGRKRHRRSSFYSGVESLREMSSARRVPPEIVLPAAFKTISHRISDVQATDALRDSDRAKKIPQFADVTWHTEPVESVASTLQTDGVTGLKSEQVEHKRKQYGLNVQSKPPSGLLRKIFMYFFGGFGPLLMVGGILCCVSWKPLGDPPASANLVLGVVLFIVFLAQAVFNFWQDFSSSKVMGSIQEMIPDDCSAVRDGKMMVISSKEIVPGDLILFSVSSKVPADVRIVSFTPDLAFDRSVLTGESRPVPATSQPEKQSTNYLESNCIALQGTFCTSGSGAGIVVSTGDSTVFGQISKLTTAPKTGLTPIQKEILRFVILTTSIIISLIVLICILWGAWLRKDYPDWISVPALIVDIVSVAVAFIPEGLPIALTTCLIITASAMRRNKILCKTLSVVETLGSVSILCLDKTGTLTKNKMTVTDFCIGTKTYEAVKFDKGKESLASRMFFAAAKFCNEARFDPSTLDRPLHERKIIGNATDQAILMLEEEKNFIEEKGWNKVAELGFNSNNKFMANIHKFAEDGTDCNTELKNNLLGVSNTENEMFFAIKGAPDILLERCNMCIEESDDAPQPLDYSRKDAIKKIQRDWSLEGKRVVLLATKIIKTSSNFDDVLADPLDTSDFLTSEASNSLVFVGLVGITDPPKDDILDVVGILREAGIRLAMVTGDYDLTAVAIARKCGIVTSMKVDTYQDLSLDYPILDPQRVCLRERNSFDKAIVITSKDITLLNDNQWEQLSEYQEIVFARTTPEQKLRIVEEFQKRKHIVGMTGDGVNDAPSLKQADVGIAVAGGSDIAKEASDLILLESFSSMVEALKYGRLVFENLRKTIAYLLPAGTYAELWPVLLNVIFGLPQALSSFCMILICCLTDCSGAITLAYEAAESNLLEKKPRSISGERLVDYKLFLHSYFTIGTYYAFTSMLVCFVNFQRHGIPFKVLTLSYGDYGDYSSDKITKVGEISSSVYFVNLVILQFFNLMAVRTRHLSFFQHPPAFNKKTRNPLVFVAILFALAVTFFFNYIPWFNNVMGTAHIGVEYYFIAVGFGAVVFVYDELRKMWVRKHPNSFLARIAW